MSVDKAKVMQACRSLLEAIGEDPDREGLRDTPRRYADLWAEFIDYEPGTTSTAFASDNMDQMVIVSGMRVWSMCEHHLLPFWCDVAVGYIANGRVLGLSKFGRIAHEIAHKLQLQERLCEEIADRVAYVIGTEDVAVIASGEHLCMSCRGIKTPALMTSSAMRGAFKTGETRAEFLKLACLRAKS